MGEDVIPQFVAKPTAKKRGRPKKALGLEDAKTPKILIRRSDQGCSRPTPNAAVPSGSKDLMAGSLDIHIASLEDSLIDGMSFANRATASYITGRRSTSFPTQSGGVFSSTNQRIMRFNLSDSDAAWSDGGTLRVAFTIHNAGAQPIQPNTLSPGSLFRRLRILCGGTEVFDLLDYGRCHQLFAMQLPVARQQENAVEGWGEGNNGGNDPSTLSHAITPLALAQGAHATAVPLCQSGQDVASVTLGQLGPRGRSRRRKHVLCLIW